MACKLCTKNPVTEFGKTRRCAFDENGDFAYGDYNNNFHCGTLEELQEISSLELNSDVDSENNKCYVIPFDDGFIILIQEGLKNGAVTTYYPNIVMALYTSGKTRYFLDLDTAEEAINHFN